jgi:hypothetical protein
MENELSGAVDMLPGFVWTVFLLPSLGSSCWSLWQAHAPTVPLTSLSEFPPARLSASIVMRVIGLSGSRWWREAAHFQPCRS